MKGYLVVVVLVILAFAWGYQGVQSKPSQPQPQGVVPQSAPPSSDQPLQPPPSVTTPSAPVSQPVAPAGLQPPAAEAGKAGDNPYVEFMKSFPKPTPGLAETMDSIHSGEIQDAQVMRRNAYFEKLSQQLKELRGEATPPATTPSTNPAANPANPVAPADEPVTTSTPPDDPGPPFTDPNGVLDPGISEPEQVPEYGYDDIEAEEVEDDVVEDDIYQPE